MTDMTRRAQTTPASTPGSFAPHAHTDAEVTLDAPGFGYHTYAAPGALLEETNGLTALELEARRERDFDARDLVPGDTIDATPILEALAELGVEIDESDQMVAEDEYMLVEAIERYPDRVVLYSATSGMNLTVPADLPVSVDHTESTYTG